MITINLQYLAVIPLIFSVIWCIDAIIAALHINQVDVGWIYRGIALENCVWSAGASILTLLIWRAFRTI